MPIGEVSIAQLADLLAADVSPAVRLIDVREVDEYVAGHVPGAVLVPLSTVPEHVDAFRGDGPAYIICKSGGRSLRAAEFLAAQGVDTINVAGGTMAWVQNGHEVVAGDQPS